MKISKNFYGMGDIIFVILLLFEYLQLLSLSPTLIDEDSSEMVKKLSIYPMNYLVVTDNIVSIQM